MGRPKGSKNKPKPLDALQEVSTERKGKALEGSNKQAKGVQKYLECGNCDTPILVEFPLYKVGDDCTVSVKCPVKGCGFQTNVRGSVKVMFRDY